MKQMERTLISLDGISENVSHSLNNPTADMDCVINCLANTTVEHFEKAKRTNQEPKIGINVSGDSSDLNCNQGASKHFGNVPLNNVAKPIQNGSHDPGRHIRNKGEISEEENTENSNSDLFLSDEACAIPNDYEPVDKCIVECSNKNISEVKEENINRVNDGIVNSTESVLKLSLRTEFVKSVSACSTCDVEGNNQEQINEDNKNKSKDHDKNDPARESHNVNKILQLETKQQSSEIKECVMGFPTKYANANKASSCNATPHSSFWKKEYADVKQIHVLNSDDNASDIPESEHIEDLKMKKSLDCTVSDAELAITNTMAPKLQFIDESKNLVSPGLSQSWHFELPVENSSSFCPQAESNKNNKKDKFEFNPNHSFQTNKFNFPVSKTEQACSSGIISENGLRIPCSDIENSCDNNTTSSEVVNLPLKCNSKLNTFVTEKLLENPQYSLNSNFLNESCCLPCDSQNENVTKFAPSANVLLSDHCYCKNNNFGNDMICATRNTLHSIAFNTPCPYESTNSLRRNNKNFVVNSLISPWEKMSFQPQTTPSINSPILSSKSSDDSCSSKFTGSSEFKSDIFQARNEDNKIPVCFSKLEDASRKTKSSEAVNCSGQVCPSTEDSSILNDAHGQNFGDSYFKTTGSDAYTNCSKFSTICGENLENACDFTGNNPNGNSRNVFVGDGAKRFNIPIRENLVSDSIYYESSLPNSPFKGNSNNPFTKRPPVESIGLFKSPMKTTVSEVNNLVFKPMSLSFRFTSPVNIKIDEHPAEVLSRVKKANDLKESTFKESSQFVCHSKLENKSNQIEPSSLEFMSSVYNEALPVDPGKQERSCGQVQSVKSHEQAEFLKQDTLPSQSDGKVNPFQFQVCPEKPRLLSSAHRIYPLVVKKSVRKDWLRPLGKGSSKHVTDVKENVNACSIAGRDIDVPFKPVYGSDLEGTSGVNKNVFVRYQNIVFMEEYVNVSPEELRSQFYSKMRCEPFLFSASLDTSKALGYKKTQTQESQTDEVASCKKPDMAGIWRIMECPVCLDVMLPPVYQCEQGHHACLACWNKVVTCPLCKRPKSKTRNYMAEALVEQIPLPCRYRIVGCKESVLHSNKVSHEETCLFRMYQCPVPLCNQAHSYQEMCKHFRKHHKPLLHHEGHSVGKGEKFCDVLYKESLTFSLVHAFHMTKWGLFFLREVTVQRTTALFVQVMPAAADEAAYFYCLEVSDHHDRRKECYKGRVFPLGKLTQEIVDQEEYLSLSKLILKTVKQSTPLKIVVTIWQLNSCFYL